MNDLIRPPLYGAWHEVRPVRKREPAPQRCLRRRRAGLRERAISSPRTGSSPQRRATCSPSCRPAPTAWSMSSNYNSRPRAAEVLVHGAAAVWCAAANRSTSCLPRSDCRNAWDDNRLPCVSDSARDSHQPPPALASGAPRRARRRGGVAAYLFQHRQPRQGVGAKARAKGQPRRAGLGRGRRAGNRAGAAAGDRQRRGLFQTVALKARVDGQIVDGQFQGRPAGEEGRSALPHRSAAVRGGAAPGRGATRCATRRRATRRARRKGATRSCCKRISSPRKRTRRSAPMPRPRKRPRKASQAALENARLNLEYCTIRSPLDGFVGKVLLQAGNMVQGERRQSAGRDQPGAADLRQLRGARAERCRRCASYMAQAPLTVEVAADRRRHSRSPRASSSSSTTRSTRPPARSACARSSTTSTRRCGPGSSSTSACSSTSSANAIVVPSRAVQTGPDGQYVYVDRADS